MPPLPALRRHFARQLAFLGRRLDPGQALGLTLTVGLVVAVGAGGAFAVVLEDALDGDGVAALDRPVLRFLAARRDDEATAVARVVTFLGGVPFVVLVTVALVAFLWSRSRRAALVLAASVVGSGLITAAIKLLVARDRPALPLAIDRAESGFSFPSGHSLSSLALYGSLSYLAVLYLPTWRSRTYVVIGLLTLAIAVGFSRLYLGYHWVSDVLGSWTLAGLWLVTVFTADRLLTERHRRSLHGRPDPQPGSRRPSLRLGWRLLLPHLYNRPRDVPAARPR